MTTAPAPPSSPTSPARSSPASRKPDPRPPFQPERRTTLPTSPQWTKNLLTQLEGAFVHWSPADYGRSAAHSLQDFGILDPVAWAGTTQSLGAEIFARLFPSPNPTKGASALAPRYVALLTELSSVNPLDVGHACHICCRFALTDLLYSLTTPR